MDHLPLTPTPPAAPLLALPAPITPVDGPRPSPIARSKWVSALLTALTVVWNLLLLPLRLLWRLAVDFAAVLGHLWCTLRESALALLLFACLVTAVVVEAFGENFFLGDVFQTLFPGMRAAVPDNPIGALLVALIPQLDDLRASAIFSFVIAGSSALGMALFFGGLNAVLQARVPVTSAVQERLLLDVNGQEQPGPLAASRVHPSAYVQIGVGALTGALILTFEIYALHEVVDYGWLGPLCALLLFAARVVVGYIAHAAFERGLAHGIEMLRDAEAFVFTLVSLGRSLLEELLDRLRNLATR